jgi:hypothetical protein
MTLTVAHLRALLARPECRDDMPVVISNYGSDFTEKPADAACIDLHDQLLINVGPDIYTAST